MKKTLPLALLLLCCLACEQQPYRLGERLYKVHCANCHMDDGSGLGALIPPLAGADYLSDRREKLACIVRHGLNDTIVVNGKMYAEQMLGNDKLTEIQITNVLNFVLQSWGNNQQPLTFDDVKTALSQCQR